MINPIALDTNIILEDATNIFNFGDSTIIISEVVLDEVDSKKSGHTEIAYQAREFGRLLQKAERLGTDSDNRGTFTKLSIQDVSIIVVALTDYYIPAGFNEKNVNDYKIVYTAKLLNAKLITNDIACGLKAEAMGIPVESLRLVEKTDFQFIKPLELTFDQFSNINNTPISDVDPEYSYENFNYLFSCPDTSQVKLGYIDLTGKVKVIGKDTETDLNRQALPPLNAGQKFFSRAILDPSYSIVVVEALAGSGKTAQALSSAMRLVGTNSPYDSIIYIRASVSDLESAEEVGFLPGMEEKFAPYLHPIYDSLEAIARKTHSNSKLSGIDLEDKIKTEIESMIRKFNIQPMITLGMRGRTFSNSVVIIDEAQNMSQSSLQKVLTRFGKNCKVIIIGSNRQIDHPYINKYNNGLSVILNACTQPNDLINITAVTLTKVVRSSLAEFAEKVFSK